MQEECRWQSFGQRAAYGFGMTCHGAPQIPIPQCCALLVPILEGEHHQNQVAANPVQVPFDLRMAESPMKDMLCLHHAVSDCAHAPTPRDKQSRSDMVQDRNNNAVPSPIQARPVCLQGRLHRIQRCRCLRAGGNCCLTCLLGSLCWRRPGVQQPPEPRHAGRAAQQMAQA